MTPEQFYRETFLDNADEYRWSTEPISIPRLLQPKSCGANHESVKYRKCVEPANYDTNIKQGGVYDLKGRYVCPLQRLSACGSGKNANRRFNKFINNIERKPNPTPSQSEIMAQPEWKMFRKYWLFGSYTDDALMQHVVFDIDIHSDDPAARVKAEATLDKLREI